MATSDRPSLGFETFDLKRARVPAAVTAEESAASPIPEAERLAIAQGLRDLGFLPAQIEQILEGPSATSVEAVTGRVIGARTMPPIKACELLEGMPYHQVITFQVMAPINAPKITCWSTTPGSTMPLPMVAATLR